MKNKFKKVGFVLGLAVFIIAFCAGAYYFVSKFTNNSQEIAASNSTLPDFTITETKTTKPDKLEINEMYFGDVFWGRYVNDWAQASDLKEAYPFSGLADFNRENYQAWIGSLNCPITDRQVSSADQEETLTFNCTPNYVSEAKKWFNIFSLANSHTNNQFGLTGFNSTREYLDQAGIQYFGHYDKDVTDEICEVVSVKTKATLDRKDYYVPIAMCGYHDTFSLPTQEQLDEIAKYSNLFPTFVYAIQGAEYPTTADEMQQEYFRKMIDEGADAVIGKGAHVVQNTEAYRGKPIIYSMGNFIYDQQFSADVTQGIGVEVKMQFPFDANLEKWQQLGASCAQFKDNCLQQAKDLKLTKPNFLVDYNIIATDNSGKLAKKASDEIQQRMLTRTNWLETLKGLDKN